MFSSARIKLTLWYLTIIMMVSITFSVVIFGMVSREVDRFEMMQRTRVERRLQTDIILPPGSGAFRRFIDEHGMANPELVQETKERILYILFLANGSIFILSGWLGYVLAGRTLRPIQNMVDGQNRFISDASHELKTPLASLKIAFEVYLRDHKRTFKDADLLVKESVEEVEKLEKLTASLLELAEYEHGEKKHSAEQCSLTEVIDEALRKTKNIAQEKKIKFKLEISDWKIKGNKKQLVNLLVILIDNAIKYSFENSTITLTTSTEKGKILVHIKDQGIGIGSDDLPRIFDRFYRADSARTGSDSGGNGLGLSIARQIAIRHGGTIRVESKLKQGSTFTLELPLFTNL